MLLQVPFGDWLGSNLAFVVFSLGMLLIFILMIYIKFFVRYFYEGEFYRQYRFGKVIKESDQGGLVALIPFFDRLEVFEKEFDDYLKEN
jgi:regulator of protease activity HflC (stomatin/prohibitin superfamily)